MPMSLIMRMMSSIWSGSEMSSGRWSLTSGIGQEALFLALGDQLFQTRLLVFGLGGHGVLFCVDAFARFRFHGCAADARARRPPRPRRGDCTVAAVDGLLHW